MQSPVSDDVQSESASRYPPGKRHKRRKGPTGLRNFAHWDREDQWKAFSAWLPQELHDAPGIDWKNLAPKITGYLIRSISNSPDAAVMAIAAASMHGAIDQISQYAHMKQLGSLLRDLRAMTSFQSLADLKQEHIWFDWAAIDPSREN